MSAEEIKTLRKQGKLDEALKIAHGEWSENANNIWCKRNLAWVYDAYCNRYAEEGNLSEFKSCFEKLKNIIDIGNEQMLSNSLCWRLRALMHACCSKTDADRHGAICDEVFDMCLVINPEKPSDGYSALIHEFYKHKDGWSRFNDMCDWWGLDHFKKEDYAPVSLDNGRKMGVSLVEMIYLGYMRNLIARNSRNDIEQFMPRLDDVMENYPEMMYLGYYKGKLLLLLGDTMNMLTTLIPFARMKKNEFWIWQLLAEAMGDDEERELACLLRSVNCKTKAEFLVNVRWQLAKLLIKREDSAGAKLQIDEYLRCKKKNEQRVSSEVMAAIHQDWYKKATGKPQYASIDYMAITQEILFSDVPERAIVVTRVNAEKGMANAIYDKGKTCFFKYNNLIKGLCDGALLKVRFAKLKEDGYAELSTARIVDDMPSNSFFKKIQGKVIARENSNFGFVENCFISPALFAKQGLSNGCRVEVQALYGWNNKKGEWTWKCICLKKID